MKESHRKYFRRETDSSDQCEDITEKMQRNSRRVRPFGSFFVFCVM